MTADMMARCIQVAPGVTVCKPPTLTSRRVLACPTCDRRRRFVVRYGGGWYDDTLTCLGCGDAWSGDWRLERPFRRGWRTEAIAKAREQWATAVPWVEYVAAVMADLAPDPTDRGVRPAGGEAGTAAPPTPTTEPKDTT